MTKALQQALRARETARRQADEDFAEEWEKHEKALTVAVLRHFDADADQGQLLLQLTDTYVCATLLPQGDHKHIRWEDLK